MAISSTAIEQALQAVNELALPLASATYLYMTLCGRTNRRIQRGRRRPSSATSRSVALRRAVSGLGMALTLAPLAAAAQPAAGRRVPVGAHDDPLGVRSEPGRFPPPRLPGPAEPRGRGRAAVESPPRTPARRGPAVVRPIALRPPWLPDAATAGVRRGGPAAHPAVHASGRTAAGVQLFARAGAATPARSKPDAPGKGGRIGWHAVLPGETLWSIAAERLHTNDIRRIARYWPRIHRANRDEIGPNPDLIRPGQVLELPPETP